MLKFKVKFTYSSNGVNIEGNGGCKAKNKEDAMLLAKKKIAEQFGGSVDNVNITSIKDSNNEK